MPLKTKETNPKGDAATNEIWCGPWGEIATTPVPVVSFRGVQHGVHHQTHCYPYHVLTGWWWLHGDPEKIHIKAGRDLITINGTGLQKLVEALDGKLLKTVSEPKAESREPSNVPIRVFSISVDSNRLK